MRLDRRFLRLLYDVLYWACVFVVLATAICFLFARLTQRSIGQPIFGAIGLGLVTLAASASFYCLWPYRLYGFPMGSGGVLGIGAAHFLRNHFASLGTFLLLAATWVVGVILLTENLVQTIFG